jgi:hypothetical protein
MGKVDALAPGYYVTRGPAGLRHWVVLFDGRIAEVPPAPAGRRRNARPRPGHVARDRR